MESLSEATQEYLESIYWLYESGIERTQANLARALQVSQPSVSEMLRRMVDDDLVSRDEAKLAARWPSASWRATAWSRPTS
jgi:DtxR family Mn-dependent transcriptional regulator